MLDQTWFPRHSGEGHTDSVRTGEEVDAPLDGNEPTGRRARNKAEKRQRITAAATELFNDHGFEGTTTAAVAERAGIGTGTLYLYISSKEELLVSIFCERMGDVWDEAFASVDPHVSLLEQLVSLFNLVADYHEQDHKLSRAYFKDLTFVGPTVIHDAVEFIGRYHDRLTRLLEERQAEGCLDPEVEAAALSDNLWAIWQQLMQRRYAERLTWEGYLARLESGFRIALFGISPPRSKMSSEA